MKTLLLFALFLCLSFSKSFCDIVYTDINPDSTVAAKNSVLMKSFYVDLDNNASYEFELRHFNPGPGNEDVELVGNYMSTQKVIITSDGHAKVLSLNDKIESASSQWGNDQYGILNSPWYGAGDKFLGVRFKINGNWHYGWIRVEMPADHLSFTIKDFAYQGAANQSILAGEGIISNVTDDNSQSDILLYPNPVTNSLNLKNLIPGSDIRIINSIGQTVIEKWTEDENLMFDIAYFPPGIYLLKYGTKTFKFIKI